MPICSCYRRVGLPRNWTCVGSVLLVAGCPISLSPDLSSGLIAGAERRLAPVCAGIWEYRQPSAASNKVSCAPGCGRSRRAKIRIVSGQAASWFPAGPSRSSPVSSVTCASSTQQARCAQKESAQARRRGARGPRRGRRWRYARPAPAPAAGPPFPLAEHPPDRVGQLEAAAVGQLVQVSDQGVAGSGAVAGDHQLPPEPRRQRGDRRVRQADMVSGRVVPGRAAAQHPGQRLPAGVIAHRDQGVTGHSL